MNSKILNKEFQHPADGYYQIEPKGDHPNRAAGVVQVIDGEATTAIVNRFNVDAAAGKLSHGRELLIDHEHFADQADQESRAYGWLTALQNRSDGIYGRVRWTGTGQKAVDDGDYRFFSTEYDPADLQILNDAKPRRVRPLRLAGLTLTNTPNNRGGKPITNRTTASMAALDLLEQHIKKVPMLALEAWFAAIGKMKDMVCRAANNKITFQHAWDLCKQQYPDLYKAAFGNDTDTAPADFPAAAKAATDDIGEVANRVSKMTGLDFRYGWKFVEQNLPHVFNRQYNSQRLALVRLSRNDSD